MKSNRIEIAHEGKVPNPLDIFPSKSDSLTSAFFDVSVPKRKRQLEAMEKWLNPNEIKPEFGIKVIFYWYAIHHIFFIIILFIRGIAKKYISEELSEGWALASYSIP